MRKVHVGIDAAILEVRVIEAIDNATGDAPILSCLPDQIPVEETSASVSGDGGESAAIFNVCNGAAAEVH